MNGTRTLPEKALGETLVLSAGQAFGNVWRQQAAVGNPHYQFDARAQAALGHYVAKMKFHRTTAFIGTAYPG